MTSSIKSTDGNISPSDFKLLIHHHDIAYVDDEGEIWMTAGIGRWISALADHFREIGLLVHQSNQPLTRQDTPIAKENVRLFSLGAPGYYWDRIARMRRIRQVCRQVGGQADGLLIRGLTPRQHVVWNNTPVARKAFFLVGSPGQRRIVRFTFKDILSAVVSKHREHEFGQIMKNSALLLANSPTNVSTIEHLYRKKAIFVPTNTIQKAEFATLHVRPVSAPYRLLYCGRLDLLKGLREIFRAVHVLQQQGQQYVLDLVAPLKEPTYSQLLTLANQLGIADRIYWHGYVPYGPELFEFYKAADVFALPTYTEGFPRVLWEAAANCCPTVTTAVGGIPALWKHEEHGLLIPPKNVDALVSSLQRLVSDEVLRSRLTNKAYKHALDYSVESCAQKMACTLAKRWE